MSRSEEERFQKMLKLLNKAALSIRKARTREKIFAAASEELEKAKLHAVIMLFNEEKTAGRIAHITAKESLRKLKKLEIPVSELEFPLNFPFFRNLIKKKKAYYIEGMKDTLLTNLSSSMYEMCEEILEFLNIAEQSAIVAPLIIDNETTGLLAVISPAVTRGDIPSITAFANQVSSALENAQLREESHAQTEELIRNLKQQELLRKLNTELFLAQSVDEVLNAAIEGIYSLGKSFSNIAMLNDERTHASIERLKMESNLSKAVEKIARTVISGFSLLGYKVPVWEEENIYHTFFKDTIPMVTSNVDITGYRVIKTDMFEIYSGFAPREPVFRTAVQSIAELLPYRSVMVFPIVVKGETVGTLTHTSREVFSQQDFELMNTVGEMVSGAMERVMQSEELTETLHELRAVQKINTMLNMGASLKEVLEQISASVKEIYGYEFAFPLLLDPSRRYLTFAHVSLSPDMARRIREVLGEEITELKYPVVEGFSLFQVIEERKFLILKGFAGLADIMPVDELRSVMKEYSSDLSKALGLDPGKNNIMITPLPCGDEVIGIFFLGHKKLLTNDDFRQLEHFLDQVGIAIAKSEVESKLRQSLKELRELDQMKSEFIDIASHELRTPLTTLKLYLEMMALEQYGRLSEPLRKRIQVMEEGVKRLEEIINQTLVASRLIKNKLTLEKAPVSLLDLATEVVHQLRPLWKAKNQNIFVESPPHLSPVTGDKKALFTVISNLMDNAIRYSPINTEIFIKFVETPAEVECMVIDQGCGIPPEHTDKIFEEFYIVPSEKEYARMDSRTGLGLFIAKGIIQRHNGKIWVESMLGEGSVFHFAVHKCDKSD